MWQLYALGSLIASSGESVVDKIAIVADRRIDSLVATFWRLALFFLFTLVIGYFGWLGGIRFSFNALIALVAAMGIGNSLIYTYLLRRVEITGIGAITYLSPFLFLIIDTRLLHTTFSGSELAGIFLMVLGGFAFAIDGKTHHFKREFSPLVWLMLFYMVAYTGVESYAFKYLHDLSGTTAVGFTLSYGVLMVAGLLALVVVRGKSHLLWKHAAKIYVPRVAISKAFDAASSVLWVQALTLAAVSQVSAMEALEPLVLFVFTVIVQDFLRLRTDEKLSRGRMRWKAAAVSMLVLGGLLVS
jgi:drug/metabolite transporter (DMT)-like permease